MSGDPTGPEGPEPSAERPTDAGDASAPSARRALELLAYAFVFPVATAAGFWAGRWIGERVGLPQTGAIVGAVVGFVAGFYELYRTLKP